MKINRIKTHPPTFFSDNGSPMNEPPVDIVAAMEERGMKFVRWPDQDENGHQAWAAVPLSFDGAEVFTYPVRQ